MKSAKDDAMFSIVNGGTYSSVGSTRPVSAVRVLFYQLSVMFISQERRTELSSSMIASDNEAYKDTAANPVII